MQVLLKGVFVGAAVIAVSNWVYADDASKQMQLLNSQLQVQLQAMQKAQQAQIKQLNKQLQAEMKTVQEKLEAEIKAIDTTTNKKLNSMQARFQAEIKAIHEAVLTGGELPKASTNMPSNEAPETITDGSTGNTEIKSQTVPVGLQ